MGTTNYWDISGKSFEELRSGYQDALERLRFRLYVSGQDTSVLAAIEAYVERLSGDNPEDLEPGL